MLSLVKISFGEPRDAGKKLRNSLNLLEPLYRRSGFSLFHSVPVLRSIYFLISVPLSTQHNPSFSAELLLQKPLDFFDNNR